MCGTLTNRVAVDRPVVVRSVNGPEVTVIEGVRGPTQLDGTGGVRCAYLTNGAVLSGFTLTNGSTQLEGDVYPLLAGGGVWCESTNALVTNCVITGSVSVCGGAAFSGTLNQCMIWRNSATDSAGGAWNSTLNHCTLSGNFAQWSVAGALSCTLNNCVLTGNGSMLDSAAAGCALNNCTLTRNSSNLGAAASGCVLNNCILYYNTGSPAGH